MWEGQIVLGSFRRDYGNQAGRGSVLAAPAPVPKNCVQARSPEGGNRECAAFNNAFMNFSESS